MLAAWNDRLKTASANLAHFLDGLGGHAKQAAGHMPALLRTGLLWKNYHGMNVFELAQLFIDFTEQALEHQNGQPSGQLEAELHSGFQTLEQDSYKLWQATRGPRSTRAERVATAAQRFRRDADNFAAIHDFSKVYPDGPLSARLFGFTVEGMTNNSPNPPTAP
jgi:uncharacterized iron-regulated membrane protein